MKIKFTNVIFLSVLSILVSFASAEQPVSLLDQFNRVRANEEVAIAFIRSLSKKEVFTLCNQYGAAVDRCEEGNEGMFIEVALNEVKRKEDLSSADLLDCASLETASVHWRRLALRYASGTGSFIDKRHIDSESALRFYSGLVTNPAVVTILRDEACQASARILVDGYYIVVCGSADRDKSRRNRVRTADTGACQTHDKKVAAFIDLALMLAEEKSTPEDLKDGSIPKALRLIIHEKGVKTPRFDQIQRLAEQGSRIDVLHKRLPYEKLLREVIAAATEFEKASK